MKIYKIGDKVKIYNKFKTRNDCLWIDEMDNTLKQTGKIIHINNDLVEKRFQVKFDNNIHSYYFKAESFDNHRKDKLKRLIE